MDTIDMILSMVHRYGYYRYGMLMEMLLLYDELSKKTTSYPLIIQQYTDNLL